MRTHIALALLIPAALTGCASQKTLDAQAESVNRQLDAQATTVTQQLAQLQQAQSSLANAQKSLEARLGKLESEQALIANRLNQESATSSAVQRDLDILRSQTSATQREMAALTDQVGSQTAATRREIATLTDQLGSQTATTQREIAALTERVGSQTAATQSELAAFGSQVSNQTRAIAQAQDTANDAVKIARDSRLVSGKVTDTLLLNESMVSYGYEQPELTAQGRAALDQLIAGVRPKLPHVFVEIIGFTDNLSLDSQNRRIALERAESVRRYLHEIGGIPLDRMSTISYGDAKPVASSTVFGGQSENRRVFVQVLK